MAGRPRKFDEEQVLDQAMTAFWTHGFEATSMADLELATGLHKGSLYGAFGNKHQLFVTSLKRYLDDMRREKTRLLAESSGPLQGVSAVLHGMLEMADDDAACPKGCLAINSLIELGPHDPEVKALMESHMDLMLSSLAEVVQQAQDRKEISRERPADLIAMMMFTFLTGLATQLKGRISKDQAHLMLDAQIDALS